MNHKKLFSIVSFCLICLFWSCSSDNEFAEPDNYELKSITFFIDPNIESVVKEEEMDPLFIKENRTTETIFFEYKPYENRRKSSLFSSDDRMLMLLAKENILVVTPSSERDGVINFYYDTQTPFCDTITYSDLDFNVTKTYSLTPNCKITINNTFIKYKQTYGFTATYLNTTTNIVGTITGIWTGYYYGGNFIDATLDEIKD